MQNLDQIRAAAALRVADKTSRQAVSKLPSMILQNGLLAAAAFASELKDGNTPKRPEMNSAMIAIGNHLKDRAITNQSSNDIRSLIDHLSAGSSSTHQRATQEALAFLSFLKRFAAKDEKQS